MKTEQELVEEIHKSFDGAHQDMMLIAQNLEEELNRINIPTISQKEEIYTDLSKLGFNNIKSVQEVTEKRKLRSEKEDEISKLRKKKNKSKFILNAQRNFLLPLRLITYTQVVEILEKYDLYFGLIEQYIGEVPEQNAKNIISYNKTIKKKIEKKFNGIFYRDQPIFIKAGSTYYGSAIKTIIKNPFMIVAPFKDFDSKHKTIFNRQIIDRVDPNKKFEFKLLDFKPATPDPIVLHAFYIDGVDEPVFNIVDAWGPEASDERVIKPANN